MIGDRLDNNRPELQTHNNENCGTMMAMLAISMRAALYFDNIAPETTEVASLPDDDPGLLGVVELVLPTPDKVAVNIVNSVAEDVDQTAQLAEGVLGGDVGQMATSGINLIASATTPADSATGDAVFDRASQLATEISTKMKGNEFTLAA